MGMRRFRYLLVFLVAIFTVNSIAAAARACTFSQVRAEHTAIQLRDAGGDELNCSESDFATGCVTHCAQDARSGEQKAPADLPLPAFAPPSTVVYFSSRPAPIPLPVASSQLIVGPSLTILFGHLRI